MQRDLPNWGLPSRPQVTERLLRMLAASSGQIWNASKIGQSLGLTYHTVNRYADYLAGAFLIRQLPPFEPNVRKRVTKRPKLHWRDSGLLHAVLQVVDQRPGEVTAPTQPLSAVVISRQDFEITNRTEEAATTPRTPASASAP